MTKNNQPLKIRYTYEKPETEGEAQSQKMRVDQAYNLLFEEVMKDREREKQAENN